MDVSKLPNHHPVPWNTTFEPMALPAMFARSTWAAPDAPLLHFLGRSYTYDELFRDAQAFAQALIGRGIAAGDRVVLFLPNVPSYVVAYYGAMMAGAVVVNFSPLYSVEELEEQVARTLEALQSSFVGGTRKVQEAAADNSQEQEAQRAALEAEIKNLNKARYNIITGS